MKGIDVSHWQGAINWKNTGVGFAILKASQGTKYVDPMLATNKSNARRAGIHLGYYHFANGDDPKAEAKFFVKTVGDMLRGEFLVLDWEIQHIDPVWWCNTFLDEVKKQTNIKPMLYINSSTATNPRLNWSPVINGDYGLWIASYGLNLPTTLGRAPKIGKWPFYAIWQYSSRGKINGINGYVDLNYTKMDHKTLDKYGKK